MNLDGKILLLGCYDDNVTFLHYAEHVVDIPGKRVVKFKVPVDENGARVWREMEGIPRAGGPQSSELAGPSVRSPGGHVSAANRQFG